MDQIIEELWVELQGKSKEEALEILTAYTEDIYAQGMSDGYDTSLEEQGDENVSLPMSDVGDLDD